MRAAIELQCLSVPAGRDVTRVTLQTMARLVRESKKAIAVRMTALDIVGDLPSKYFRDEIEALFVFVRDHIRYVGDVRDIETLHTPELLLQTRQGDCDDKAVLLASLIETIDNKTRFVAVGFRQPGLFEHVFMEVKYRDSWISLDPSVEGAPMGWRPDGIVPPMMIEHV